MAKKKKQPKQRNRVVLSMITRSWGSGKHSDARKERSRKACRGRYRGED